MKNVAGLAAAFAALGLLLPFSAAAYPADDGNLFGAAEVCGLSTAGLPYSNSPDFQYARERARTSRQDCQQVAFTVSRYNTAPWQQPTGGYVPGVGSGYDQGNLYGAAEACNLPTTGLPYSGGPDFENGRQMARRSRQDCQQVAYTVGRLQGSGLQNPGLPPLFGNAPGYGYASAADQGNLFGAAEACGIATFGLPYANDAAFQNSRQRARNSRQDCSQVAATVNRTRGR